MRYSVLGEEIVFKRPRNKSDLGTIVFKKTENSAMPQTLKRRVGKKKRDKRSKQGSDPPQDLLT